MGRPMGRRLLDAGDPVVVYDLAPAVQQAAREDGAAVAGSPADAVMGADVVITMLPGPDAVTAASHREHGILAGLRPGALWMEMSSSNPWTTLELAQAAEERQAALLDAPVSGGVLGAEEGTLTIFVGGTAELLERARPLLDLLGSNMHHVGDLAGDGDLAKTINNLLSAINLTAAAEAVTMGMRGGLDPARLVAAIGTGSGSSHALTTKIPHYVLTGNFDAGFTINQMLKDLGIGQEVAAHLEVPSPVGSMIHDIWTAAAAEGHGEDDHTTIAALMAARAGIEILPGA